MDHERARERLVARLDEQGRIERDATREALLAVPRHEFVPEKRRKDAYDDRPLPIGADQTISAPHMVAIMSDLLAPGAGDSILEIGTGCGYHAAVTAAITDSVNSVEYHASLAENARERLSELGYTVEIRVGDGHDGWAEHAPYDGAYLTCAAPEIPEAVAEQVRPGGAIVAPIGTRRQTLVRARRRADGSLDRTEHGGVRFVPMQG
ncbi:protein-L-isoaspartate(D-aspartate) O-methyltransferase [Halococcus dombrowskii]|uniref:Protein-L-isoaspartate O-methyltransferase n=1 Tax=Halococcus dombrowskii TaxID=179637 RepID=A0AAX3AQ49_HALDO|nr:protein-L-isoaspartate(D-aspartate) O-methyltransferase [Halococcus dombrowskii]UOO95890.1 protein-L-isoaspartate(D-aspartate) O-methyltransferase [Halococcus dombrowskii]